MNHDDIIRMAREAGLVLGYPFLPQHLERFAKLVAKQTKEVCEAEVEYQKQRAQIWRNKAYEVGGKPLPCDADEVLAKAVAAEREACARVPDEMSRRYCGAWNSALYECAAAIRARSEK